MDSNMVWFLYSENFTIFNPIFYSEFSALIGIIELCDEKFLVFFRQIGILSSQEEFNKDKEFIIFDMNSIFNWIDNFLITFSI